MRVPQACAGSNPADRLPDALFGLLVIAAGRALDEDVFPAVGNQHHAERALFAADNEITDLMILDPGYPAVVYRADIAGQLRTHFTEYLRHLGMIFVTGC